MEAQRIELTKCPKCGFENEPSLKTCHQCQTSLMNATYGWVFSFWGKGVASEDEFQRFLIDQEKKAGLGNFSRSDYADLVRTDRQIYERRGQLGVLFNVFFCSLFSVVFLGLLIWPLVGLVVCFWAWVQIKKNKELLIAALTARKSVLQGISSYKNNERGADHA